jgi:hypothetical protein
MLRAIRESDWKLFRELRSVALERFCERVLDETVRVASEADKTSHERYLAVYALIDQRNEELASAFDNPRRSTALVQLAHLQGHELLTEEEFSRFSSETREIIQLLMGR